MVACARAPVPRLRGVQCTQRERSRPAGAAPANTLRPQPVCTSQCPPPGIKPTAHPRQTWWRVTSAIGAPPSPPPPAAGQPPLPRPRLTLRLAVRGLQGGSRPPAPVAGQGVQSLVPQPPLCGRSGGDRGQAPEPHRGMCEGRRPGCGWRHAWCSPRSDARAAAPLRQGGRASAAGAPLRAQGVLAGSW